MPAGSRLRPVPCGLAPPAWLTLLRGLVEPQAMPTPLLRLVAVSTVLAGSQTCRLPPSAATWSISPLSPPGSLADAGWRSSSPVT